MNTLRNELKTKYSQIPNELITDLTLCHGSLRVLLYLFTKPDNWNVYNKDICKQLGISEQTLTKYWKILLASKWLRRDKARDNKGHLTGGYVYLIGNFTISIKSTEQVISTESGESIEHSNNKPITNNKLNNNTKLIQEIISNLNNVVGKKFRAETYKTLVSSLLNKGYTIEDFNHVHLVKFTEWKGTEQEKYLNPTTLYRPTNFDKYLNQTISDNDKIKAIMKNSNMTYEDIARSKGMIV